MKVIGINGSPRKGKNSDVMLDHALQGAVAAGAEVEKFHLFDLQFTGCKSCFACKRLGGESFGHCALQDDLKEVLEKILAADAVVISTPIYFGDVTGAVRNLFERIWFPGLLYSADGSIAYTKKVKTALIYTMNVPTDDQYAPMYAQHKGTFERFLGETKVLRACNTLQFDDYSKYASSQFNEAEKRAFHDANFPEDCKRAYELGKSLVEE